MERFGLAGYHPEKRRRGGAVRIAREPDIAGVVVKATLTLTAVVLTGILGLWASLEHQRGIRDAKITQWAASMSAKLRDPYNQLTSDEEYSRQVRVSAAGRTIDDQLAMQQSGILINIRNYSGTSLDGAETTILGQIAQGETIYNVVYTPGSKPLSPLQGKWGVFNCGDVGSAIWKDGQKPNPGQICAIAGEYLTPTGQ